MNKIDTSTSTGEDAAPDGYKGRPYSGLNRTHAAGSDDRLAELEIENSRLQRLVFELLIKNQQLRKPD